MKGIIETIEKLRVERNVRKTKLCKYSGVHVSMYYKYMQGASIPFNVVVSMLDYLNIELIAIPKNVTIHIPIQ